MFIENCNGKYINLEDISYIYMERWEKGGNVASFLKLKSGHTLDFLYYEEDYVESAPEFDKEKLGCLHKYALKYIFAHSGSIVEYEDMIDYAEHKFQEEVADTTIKRMILHEDINQFSKL